MRPHYRSKLATKRVRNLEHLLDLNHRIDATDPNLYRSSFNARNEIHVLDAENHSDDDYSAPEEPTVNFVQRKPRGCPEMRLTNPPRTTQTVDNSGVKCWNCQKLGHHWRVCKEPKLIFCYACGSLGRTTKTCEKNHPQTRPNTNQPNTSNRYQQSLN